MTGERSWMRTSHLKMMNRKDAYKYGIELLSKANITDAAIDAGLLLEYAAHVSKSDIYAHGDMMLSDEEYERYVEALEMRAKHMPLQYITGTTEFMGLEFDVDDNVLIPRADTEILVEEVMRLGLSGMRILDVCTGSGCILLSLLHYSNECKGVGIDISDKALEVASHNAEKLGLNATFVKSDMFESLSDEKFDIIVSNPPYIQTEVIEGLDIEVKDYEPRLALDGDSDGLKFYRIIAKEAGAHLLPEGHLFLEIGYDEGEDVKELLSNDGYREISIIKDYAGLDRVVHAIR